MIYRTAPFSVTLNDPYPSFKVTLFFDAKYLVNGTTYRYSFNEILIGTRPTQQCHFEWTWVILSDLAKYSMTRSVTRSLCDSWASCTTSLSSYVYLYLLSFSEKSVILVGKRLCFIPLSFNLHDHLEPLGIVFQNFSTYCPSP